MGMLTEGGTEPYPLQCSVSLMEGGEQNTPPYHNDNEFHSQ